VSFFKKVKYILCAFHDGTEESRDIPPIFLGARWGWGGQLHAPAALPPEMSRYPLHRTLHGPQGRSGRVWEISHNHHINERLMGSFFIHMSATSTYAINLFIFYTKIKLYRINFILYSVLQEANVGLHNILIIYGSSIKKLVPNVSYRFPFNTEATVSCKRFLVFFLSNSIT